MHRLLTTCPNIIKLHRVYENNESLFLILDYLQGGSLFDFITDKRDIYEDQISSVAGQLLLAVEYMHKIGIIHRDLKIDNILIADKNSKALDARIGDLGLSKKLKPCEML